MVREEGVIILGFRAPVDLHAELGHPLSEAGCRVGQMWGWGDECQPVAGPSG